MVISVEEKRLSELVKRAVDEALKANIKRLKIAMIPYVDDAEMKEINKTFGSPRKYHHQEFARKKL
jgi:ssRNA-specific RNase YbeY (16S rRNA maturation enzyme)